MAGAALGCVVAASFAPLTPIDVMMADLSAAFVRHGVASRLLLHSDANPNPGLLAELVGALRDSGMPGFAVFMNGKGRVLVDGPSGPANAFDAWGMPVVAFLVDHPAQHVEHLRQLPRKSLVTVIDRRHEAFLRQAGFANVVFCPHGGPDPLPTMTESGGRETDILFIGCVDDVPGAEEWVDHATAAAPQFKPVLAAILEAVLSGDEVFAAVSREFARAGLAHDPLSIAPDVVAIDAYVTQARRLAVLQAIRSRRVTVLGPVTPAAAAKLAHHDLRGPTQFPRALALMAEAKLVLNSRRSFAGGAHERVFYGLSRGAVVLTEPSLFLADEIAGGLGMVALPEDGRAIDALVDGLCADAAALDALRDRGVAAYPSRHSWTERAGRILAGLAPLL